MKCTIVWAITLSTIGEAAACLLCKTSWRVVTTLLLQLLDVELRHCPSRRIRMTTLAVSHTHVVVVVVVLDINYVKHQNAECQIRYRKMGATNDLHFDTKCGVKQ